MNFVKKNLAKGSDLVRRISNTGLPGRGRAGSKDGFPGLSDVVKDAPDWIKAGCGDEEYIFDGKRPDGSTVKANFPADAAPDKLPSLDGYTNFLSDVLRENPEIYDNLKNKKTKNGISLAKVIKTGMDNPGHPMIKTVGMVAGDEESYETFKELFDPVIKLRHRGYPADGKQPTDLDPEKLLKTNIDPTGKYILTSRIRTGRSVRGIKLPPSIGYNERRKLEGLVVEALLRLGEYDSCEGKISLKGDYFPLNGSTSYAKKPTGMSKEKEEELRSNGNLFQEPDSTLLLCSGMGRHWPDGRGIFHNDEQNLFVWICEEDHMRIISMEKGDCIKKIFVRFTTACKEVEGVLKEKGYEFMHNDHLGYILTCPSNLGTGLRAGAMIKLPLLSKRHDFKAFAGKMGLQVRGRRGVDSASEGGIFDISNADRIGKSEVDLVNEFIKGAALMIKWEGMLEKGESIDAEPELPKIDYPPGGLSDGLKKAEEWIQAGCGDREYVYEGLRKDGGKVTALFPPVKAPDQLPSLDGYTNYLSIALRKNPEIYDHIKDKKTSLGVTLAKCIKTGMDNPGHPMITTVGMVAGDEESYTVFKELFDPVISLRHRGYPADGIQPTDLDFRKLSQTRIDPTCDETGQGKYILTSRIRTGRSVRGIRLPPSISFAERRKLETLVTKALLKLDVYDSPEGKIDLSGDYFPLHGSRSYGAKPNGMTEEQEEHLRNNGNLFQEPDSTLLLSSGMGRHWPDARGIYHNKAENFFVWINEEDHMRIISMEAGDCIRKIFVRFSLACEKVAEVLKADGYEFMHSEHLGYILTCPSNLGTGLRAGSMLKLPLLSKRKDFKEFAARMGLQVRGRRGVDSASEGGIFDISNADRIGKSEVHLVNEFIEGAAKMVRWEMMLEKGEDIEHLVNYPPHGLSLVIKDAPEWITSGCGDSEYVFSGPGHKDAPVNALFPPCKAPDKLPSLDGYTNYLSHALRKNPEIYDAVKNKTTKLGVTLAKCIKTGMDNPGHPMITTVGMVAGDEESYECFKDLFDPVISLRHRGYPADGIQPTDLDFSKLEQIRIDPTCDENGDGKYILTSRIRTGRSIRGIRLPPSISFEERRKLESLVVGALLKLGEYDSPEGKIDLAGDYFPLNGSHSYAAKPTGMTKDQEEHLREKGNLFQEPDSTLLLSSGMGRHWPDSRGIYHNKAENFFVWINEEDHMRIISMEKGDCIRKIFVRFALACNKVEEVLKAEGYDFMHNDHLGYILTCPSNLGTGLRAGSMLKLPLLSKSLGMKVFKEIAARMGLQVRGRRGVDSQSEGGIFDISNADRIGKSEVHLVNEFIVGAAKMVRWEIMLENGESIDDQLIGWKSADYPPHGLSPVVKDGPEWITTGCGNSEYVYSGPGHKDATVNALFPPSQAPDKLPSLDGYTNYLSEALKKNPEIYDAVKNKTTRLGVTLAKCIKTGMDNPGHPMIKTVGMVAGDEESYECFKELFDPVIALRHSGYPADGKQPTDLDYTKLSQTSIDPTWDAEKNEGKYILTSRIRTGRSIRGIRLPPSISFEERRKLEGLVTKALLKLGEYDSPEGKIDLAGDYFPLNGSHSYFAKPNGMTKEQEEHLRSKGNLFQEPDSTLLLSSGMGRHWPDGRGIFHNKAENFFVWINEEDHMRIISMEKGDCIRKIFVRFSLACEKVAEVLQAEGYEFMHNDHLGYILTCPSNLGTGLRAGSMLKLPLLSKRKDFKEFAAKMGLQVRGRRGVDSQSEGGIFDISNADRIGKSEVALVNEFINGAAKMVQWEIALEKGDKVDDLIKDHLTTLKR